MILTAPSFLSPSSAILARHRSVPTAVVGTELDWIWSEHHDYRWVQHVFHSIALLYPPPAHTLPHRISSFQPTHADKWRRRSFYCNGNCEKGGLQDVDICVALEHPRRILCMFSMSCLLSLYILFSSLLFTFFTSRWRKQCFTSRWQKQWNFQHVTSWLTAKRNIADEISGHHWERHEGGE